MPPPSVAGREELIQRCILTAIGDVHLVDRAHAVLTQRTVGSITITRNCSTMISTHTPCVAQLTLVLQHEDALDYEQIAACIDERIASLDCLSGRASKLLRCAPLSIRTAVAVHIGSADADCKVQANGATSPSVLDRALNRNAIDRALGVRDLRLASLEQRLSFLLSLGLEEPASRLDMTMSSCRADPVGGGCASAVCPIEEITESQLDEPCCATGCEPCVWESYYKRQARTRGGSGSDMPHDNGSTARRSPDQPDNERSSASDAAADGPGTAKRPRTGGTGPARSVAYEHERPFPPAVPRPSVPPTPVPTAPTSSKAHLLRADEMTPIELVERRRHTPDTLLLTFGASVPAGGNDDGASVRCPWHVRLRLKALSGECVTRAYTVLRCAGGRMELLIKVHPQGQCSQGLARLRVGDKVEARGPIVTDAALHARLFPPTCTSKVQAGAMQAGAMHCLSAGTGISPMVQLAEALISRRELLGASHQSGRGEANDDDRGTTGAMELGPTVIRIWSVTRTAVDAVVPAYLVALQKRAELVGVKVDLACILTREDASRDGVAPPADPCARHGGESRVLVGRPTLSALLEGIEATELASAVLVVCGPDEFNESMDAAARNPRGPYAAEQIFVRDTRLLTHEPPGPKLCAHRQRDSVDGGAAAQCRGAPTRHHRISGARGDVASRGRATASPRDDRTETHISPQSQTHSQCTDHSL